MQRLLFLSFSMSLFCQSQLSISFLSQKINPTNEKQLNAPIHSYSSTTALIEETTHLFSKFPCVPFSFEIAEIVSFGLTWLAEIWPGPLLLLFGFRLNIFPPCRSYLTSLNNKWNVLKCDNSTNSISNHQILFSSIASGNRVFCVFLTANEEVNSCIRRPKHQGSSCQKIWRRGGLVRTNYGSSCCLLCLFVEHCFRESG